MFHFTNFCDFYKISWHTSPCLGPCMTAHRLGNTDLECTCIVISTFKITSKL